MNRILTNILILLLPFCILPARAQDQILVQEIEYEVPVFNALAYDMKYGIPYEDWWECNIETAARSAFQRELFRKVLAGDLQVYGDDDRLLSGPEVEARLQLPDTIKYQRFTAPFDVYDTVIRIFIEPADFQLIRFREQWTCDRDLRITKKVIAYAPVWVEYTTCKTGVTRPLFWVRCNNEADHAWQTLTPLIAYNLPVYKNINLAQLIPLNHISGDSLAFKEYLAALIREAEQGKKNIYENYMIEDFYKHLNDSLIPMEAMAAYKKFNLTDTQVLTRPYPPYNDYDTVLYDKIDPDRIVGMRYYEQWMIDPETWAIRKEIIGFTALTARFEYDFYKENLIGFETWFHYLFTSPTRILDSK